MNKKMRELLGQIQEKTNAAKACENVEEKTTLMDEVDALQAEYDAEKRVYDADKKAAALSATAPVEEVEAKETVVEAPKAVEMDAIAKFGQDAKLGFNLAKTVNEGTAADGGYAVPEDVITRIEERRAAKASLLDLVKVVNVSTNKGARTFKKRIQQTGFTKVGERGKIGEKATPQFERVEYEIEKYAGYFPVTDEVLEDSDSNLGEILVEWIGDESRVTANNLIIETVKTKDEVAFGGLDDIKKALNVTLGQALKATSKIITNDDGLQYLDTLKDSTGRDLLSPMPTDAMQMRLQVGAIFVPIVVLPNSDMPTTAGKIPFIVGDLNEGIIYWDRKRMNIKLSDTAVIGDFNAFEEDLTLYRAIEREDVTLGDADAFVNGYILGE